MSYPHPMDDTTGFVEPQEERASAWRPITSEIRHKVLVTNNINARDAYGQMSHVWVAGLVQRDDGEFICFLDGFQKIWGLTHYAELPR